MGPRSGTIQGHGRRRQLDLLRAVGREPVFPPLWAPLDWRLRWLAERGINRNQGRARPRPRRSVQSLREIGCNE